jgi:phosphoribosylformylglycinamidine synthase
VNTAQFELMDSNRGALQALWSETSHAIARRRDNADCADQELAAIQQADPGLSAALTYDCDEDIAAPFIATGSRPRVAILREQGVNGQMEMAAAFDRAGFTAVDVHMSDVMAGTQDLTDCHGLAACGGFSYGDVLGAGEGWAKSILFNDAVRARFEQFFARTDTFSLGVCNGCQMMSALQSIIPGSDHWPRFARNILSSTKRACRWCELSPRRLFCSKAWRAPICRLLWHMVKDALSFHRRVLPARLRRPV